MDLLQNPLCCIDGSPASLHAVSQVIALGATGMRLNLLCVVPPLSVDYQGLAPQDKLMEDEQNMAQAMENMLQGYVDKAREAGIEAEAVLQTGQAHEVIVEQAQTRGASVIVLGAKHEGTLRRRVLGSTTSRVIGYSTCDVLMIPENATLALGPVVVATDGSEHGDLAIERALGLCQAEGAKLCAMSVIHVTMGLDASPMPSRALENVEHNALRVLEHVQELAEERDLAVQTFIRQGTPSEQIALAAEEAGAGLIVIGSHGRTGIRRLLMGSVTERLLETATCSVLVVTK